MKSLALVLFFSSPAFAVWNTPATPTYNFDANNNVLNVTDCAVDPAVQSAAICATVTKDSNGAAFAMSGPGDLKNQAAVDLALQNALNAARTEILNNQTAATTKATNTGKITLPVPSISGT